MKERPILFSGPLVRAILDGRKTQTRRVVKPQPPSHVVGARRVLAITSDPSPHRFFWFDKLERPIEAQIACPYGLVGDRLWVRESFFEEWDQDTMRPFDPPRFVYRATYSGEEPIVLDGNGGAEERADGRFRSPWRPSIHMPRLASRITLEVVSVRVERLNEISEADAEAEGIGFDETRCDGECGSTPCSLAIPSFRDLWDSINAEKHPWASNPWVWVVEFKRVGGAA